MKVREVVFPVRGRRVSVRGRRTRQNTKLQKYTRGAVLTGRAALLSTWPHLHINNVVNQRAIRVRVFTGRGTTIGSDEPRLC